MTQDKVISTILVVWVFLTLGSLFDPIKWLYYANTFILCVFLLVAAWVFWQMDEEV